MVRIGGCRQVPRTSVGGSWIGVGSDPDAEHPQTMDQPSEEAADHNRWLDVVPNRAELTTPMSGAGRSWSPCAKRI